MMPGAAAVPLPESSGNGAYMTVEIGERRVAGLRKTFPSRVLLTLLRGMRRVPWRRTVPRSAWAIATGYSRCAAGGVPSAPAAAAAPWPRSRAGCLPA